MKRSVTAFLAGAALAFSLTRSQCRQLDRHLDGQRPAGLGV